jgi:hypothetical protein
MTLRATSFFFIVFFFSLHVCIFHLDPSNFLYKMSMIFQVKLYGFGRFRPNMSFCTISIYHF